VRGVLDDFGRARLLSFDRELASREPTVEVAHEALLREWPRLRQWLDESRADLRMQRVLGSATAEWLAAGRDASFLLRGARLDQFEAWMATTGLALTLEERAYLVASLADRQARRAAEAARQEREKPWSGSLVSCAGWWRFSQGGHRCRAAQPVRLQPAASHGRTRLCGAKRSHRMVACPGGRRTGFLTIRNHRSTRAWRWPPNPGWPYRRITWTWRWP
jgi:hypothetical protein